MMEFAGMLGLIVAEAGDYERGERLLYDRVKLCREIGNRSGIACGYGHLSFRIHFVRGDFGTARTLAEQGFKIATSVNATDCAGWCQVVLGLLTSVEDGDCLRGKQLCHEAYSQAQLMAWLEDFAAFGLAVADIGLGDFEAAIRHLIRPLKYRIARPSPLWMVMCLPVAVFILAHQAQPERAVELLGLALTHPVGAAGWAKKWALLDQLRTGLQEALGTEKYSAAWELGKSLALELVIRNLLGEFDPVPHDPGGELSTASDLLTRRELEVLRLIAAGQSNQQIADELVITLGTVRWYISQIFEKLAVRNRTQAVARGRELKLL
jgi:DNA-binding NarL/FixJ family response regulator